jgi:hypothetical protein
LDEGGERAAIHVFHDDPKVLVEEEALFVLHHIFVRAHLHLYTSSKREREIQCVCARACVCVCMCGEVRPMLSSEWIRYQEILGAFDTHECVFEGARPLIGKLIQSARESGHAGVVSDRRPLRFRFAAPTEQYRSKDLKGVTSSQQPADGRVVEKMDQKCMRLSVSVCNTVRGREGRRETPGDRGGRREGKYMYFSALFDVARPASLAGGLT